MKNNKGITLIALVITIIVLLILAGVSIAMLTGDNGILTKATESTTATDLAEVLERVNMELDAQMANALAGDSFNTVGDIEKNLGLDDEKKLKGYTITVESDSGAYNKTNDVTITITDDPDDDVTFTQKIGKVAIGADGDWEITPVKGSVGEVSAD